MKKIVGIPEIRFNGTEPSIGYTDGTYIYLSRSVLKQDELNTLRIHESSHIWLNHFNRSKAIPNCDSQLWNIASDMEIALHIYGPEEEASIKRPRSSLAKGITKEHCKKYPDCVYAEDFYNALMKEKEEALERFKNFIQDMVKDTNETPEQNENSDTNKIPVPELIEKTKKNIQEQKEEARKQKQLAEIQKQVSNFKPPKPSLASAIDMYVGRTKVTREASYRRPPRRENDYLRKGMVSKPKSPALTVYVDRSGSFCPAKTAEATRKLKEVLVKYRGKVTMDTVYFADNLMKEDPGKGGGGTNYTAVIENIKKDKAQLSIIITDDDCCSYEGKQLEQKVIVIPIGCEKTSIAEKIGAIETTN